LSRLALLKCQISAQGQEKKTFNKLTLREIEKSEVEPATGVKRATEKKLQEGEGRDVLGPPVRKKRTHLEKRVLRNSA